MNYTVKIAKSAESDILRSLEWGIRNWGVTEAKGWATQVRRRIKEQLSRFPLGCPLAPDRDLEEPDVRHLIIGRYRVLFEIEGTLVRVLHLRGPHYEPIIYQSKEEL